MKNLTVILLTLFAFTRVVAQDNISGYRKDTLVGKVIVHRDVRVDTLIKRVVVANDKKPTIRGYRIQIYSGSSRAKANRMKAAFMVNFPHESVLLIYQQPNFKIRVGNYRDRIEAMPMYYHLLESEDFRYVLLVPDDILLPSLGKK